MLPRFLNRRGLFASALAVVLGLSLSPARVQAQGKTVELTFLHTNDTHGHLMPFSYPETFDPSDVLARLPGRTNIGGAARRATLINRIRAERGREVLVTDSGDICDGTPFSTEYHGEADIAAMNAIGYDLACPGNHEYSNLLPQTRKLIANAKFPLLSANSTLKSNGRYVYQPFIIKNVGGAKVAFLGLMTYDARTYVGAKNDIVMEPPIETARRWVPELRKQADFVVAITHIGVNEDERLAREVPGIDIILGGHSHSFLPQPRLIAARGELAANAINGTIIVQDYQWGGTLGRLDVTLVQANDGIWSLKSYAGKLLPVSADIPEDPRVASEVALYWEPIKAKYAKVVGEATADFTEIGRDSAEYHLMADAVREETGAEFALENSGGVRAPVVKGPITYGDLATVDPFTNTIVTIKVNGRQLKQILLRSRPAVSGIRYVVDNGKLVDASINGQPILDDKVYAGATNSFFAGTPALQDVVEKTPSTRGRLDALVAYVTKKKVLTPAYDGRRIIRNSGSDN